MLLHIKFICDDLELDCSTNNYCGKSQCICVAANSIMTSIEQDRLVLLQPHLDERQGVPLSYPHLMSHKIASGARLTVSGIVVGTSDLLASSVHHPYFSMSRSGGSASDIVHLSRAFDIVPLFLCPEDK